MPISSPPEAARLTADIVIVGAGAVGLTLAIALARKGAQVLVVEAGPAEPPVDYQARNGGTQSGYHHIGLREGRMKAVGGTTRLWGGQLVPFAASDFAGEVYPGKPAWPIDHAALAPYYDRAFTMLAVPDWARDPQHVWAEAGAMPPQLGQKLTSTLNIWLQEPDFARFFHRELEGLPNLRIIPDCAISGLVFNPDGSVAQLETPTGQVIKGGHYVLAHGTFEIVRTLLVAQATAEHCPFAGNANIGQGFIDHLHGFVGDVHAADLTRFRAAFEDIFIAGRKFSVKVRAAEQFLRGSGLANCAATFNPAGSVRDLLRDLKDLGRRVFSRSAGGSLAGDLAHAVRTVRVLAPVLASYIRRRRSRSLFDQGIRLGLEVEQIPWRGSYIALDPAGGDVALHWTFDGRELEMAATFCEEVAGQFAAQGWGEITLDPRLLARDPALFADLHDAYHQMGGARMAASAAEGVVDANLTVFGCANLSVCGAVVYPSGSFANPTLTALALAHRLADFLLEGRPA